MNKNTPGPWKIAGYDWINTPSGGYRVALVNSKDFIVASVMCDEGDDEQAANANLIAAAPDLLEAAKHAAMEWRLHGQLTDSCRVLEAAIGKAIAKVEGRR